MCNPEYKNKSGFERRCDHLRKRILNTTHAFERGKDSIFANRSAKKDFYIYKKECEELSVLANAEKEKERFQQVQDSLEQLEILIFY